MYADDEFNGVGLDNVDITESKPKFWFPLFSDWKLELSVGTETVGIELQYMRFDSETKVSVKLEGIKFSWNIWLLQFVKLDNGPSTLACLSCVWSKFEASGIRF